MNDRPDSSSIEGMYSFLKELNDKGIYHFMIYINTPDFLHPKYVDGYGVYGERLTGMGFETDIDFAEFEEEYYYCIEQIHWDEQKFEDKVSELTDAGYVNPRFLISGWQNGSTIEITLYCESDGSLTDEVATAILEEMDDSYFRVLDNNVKYVVNHVIK